MLYVRMTLYAFFAGLAGAGIGELDPSSGVFSISVEQLAEIAAPALGFVVTFIGSRVAKARGWAT